MPRSDLILSLIRAGATGDQMLLRKAVEAMAAEERGKNHHVLAEQLVSSLKSNGTVERRVLQSSASGNEFFNELLPSRKFSDLVLPSTVLRTCEQVVEEQQRAELLRSYNLEPRSRILILGPPGNGKTSLAEALADAISVPLLAVRYEALIGSFLGETASRLRRLFEAVRSRRCLLFFDEFDTLGKERGDLHDSGEIKRVVSSLLLQIDALPSYVTVVTATNHPELLDRAVWRRFQVRFALPRPNQKQAQEWLSKHTQTLRIPDSIVREIARKLQFDSFSELEEFTTSVARRMVLAAPDAESKSVLGELIGEWKERESASPKKRGR